MKILLTVIALFCCLLWLQPNVSLAKIDPETAVGVWLFDEGAGDEAEDSSGKENHGTINGADWTDGKFGNALEFDGGQSVTIDSTPDLQLGDKHTMMVWFYATDISQHRMLIAKDAEYLLRIDRPGEGNKMSTFVHIGGWEPRASATIPDTETWIHYAATYDNSANSDQLIIYVNGERANSSTRPGNPVGNANAVEIGKWGGGSQFVGIIDEVAIFKDVLTEEDIQTIMDVGLDGALGGVSPIEPRDKLATTWGALKIE